MSSGKPLPAVRAVGGEAEEALDAWNERGVEIGKEQQERQERQWMPRLVLALLFELCHGFRVLSLPVYYSVLLHTSLLVSCLRPPPPGVGNGNLLLQGRAAWLQSPRNGAKEFRLLPLLGL